jgi:hypothetical protein
MNGDFGSTEYPIDFTPLVFFLTAEFRLIFFEDGKKAEPERKESYEEDEGWKMKVCFLFVLQYLKASGLLSSRIAGFCVNRECVSTGAIPMNGIVVYG